MREDEGVPVSWVCAEDVEAKIIEEQYYVFPGTTLTVCCLTLVNGFTVTGESAVASPDYFHAELGRNIARAHARAKIWPLEGYLLRERLHRAGIADPSLEGGEAHGDSTSADALCD
jgi:Phage protein (N4 Gp49/phage Sf6 gene 66) family